MKNTDLLIYMLEDIREVTLKGISGLTKEQLFREPVPGEYCIGSYLMHLAECDLGWLKSLTGEEQPEDLKKSCYYNSWFDVDEKDFNPPKSPIEPGEYIAAMEAPRKILIDHIRSMKDDDLEITVKRKRAGSAEIELSKKWMIYHLIEHEAHTRGQMFMLMRMAGFKKKGENN
jgi:uncharacterized damage-inducible protein DinB